MKVTWLTQAGLLLEQDGTRVMVDPYLSDSVGKREPKKHRRVPADPTYRTLHPDVLIITHDHLDHLDPETLSGILDTDTPITVLAPENAYRKLLTLGYDHNYVLLSPHSVWSQNDLTFYAVAAAHSDTAAAGFVIDDGSRTYYITGDTLYNYDVIDDVLALVKGGVDTVFLPINGVGNNMNARDAADFACAVGAKCAVPLHYGLFDDINPADFDFKNTVVLQPFVPTEL